MPFDKDLTNCATVRRWTRTCCASAATLCAWARPRRAPPTARMASWTASCRRGDHFHPESSPLLALLRASAYAGASLGACQLLGIDAGVKIDLGSEKRDVMQSAVGLIGLTLPFRW